MTATPMRGLSVFIREVLACSSKDAEEARVEKELLNIRSKFASAQCKLNTKSKRLGLVKTKAKGLKSYDKIKYIWKLVYISMLGYDIDFGHMEVINLLSSTDLLEKQAGYLAAGMLISSDSELITLIINSIRTDLSSKNHVFQSLAISAVANISGEQLSESLSGQVMNLLLADTSTASVKQKAALCMLSLYRIDPDVINDTEFVMQVSSLLEPKASRSLGIVLALMGLIVELVQQNTSLYSSLVPPVVELLAQIVVHKKISSSYVYRGVPAPWVQIKMMKFLQHFPLPKEDKLRQVVLSILNKCVDSHDKESEKSDANAKNAVVFAAIDLVVSYGAEVGDKLQEKAIGILAELISDSRRNVRYLGMACLCRLKSLDKARPYYPQMLQSLRDEDPSIRKRALDLLFALCCPSNSEDIINGLMVHLVQDAFVEMKEEVVLKIAILAERFLFVEDSKAYLDTVLKLLYQAGDFVANELVYRLIQLVTNREDVQLHACSQLYVALSAKPLHPKLLTVGTYLLGEFGYLLVESEPGSGCEPCSPEQLFQVLHSQFTTCSNANKAKLLHAYAKLAHLFNEELGKTIHDVFEALKTSPDSELQQRAIEYLTMPVALSKEKMEYVMDAMPPFNDNRVSAVVRKLGGSKAQANDTAVDNEGPEVLTEESCVENIDPAAPKQRGISPELAPKMRQWFTSCIRSPKSLLFADEIIQVGMQKQFKGNEGKVMIFVANKTESTIGECELRLEGGSEVKLDPVIAPLGSLKPMGQNKQMISITCLAPYLQPPSISLRFEYDGVMHDYALRLPAVFANFLEKAELTSSQFYTQWERLQAHEQREEIKFGRTVEGGALARLLETMNLKILLEEDPSKCIRATGVIRLGSLKPQEKATTVGCLLQLDIGATNCCLNVRCTSKEACLAIKVVLQQQLASIDSH